MPFGTPLARSSRRPAVWAVLALLALPACARKGDAGGSAEAAADAGREGRDASTASRADAPADRGAEARRDVADGGRDARPREAGPSDAAGNRPSDAGSEAAVPVGTIPDPPSPDEIPHPGRTPSPPPDLPPPVAGEMIAIPAGTFLRGSLPGLRGRKPAQEVDLAATRVGDFEIDRLPFPNDPAQEPLTNVARGQAEAKCRELGKRLCTEVEWEYACKGPRSQDYPYGDDYDAARYAVANELVSPFGVQALTAMFEWTAGDWLETDGTPGARLPARGGHPQEGDALGRRCAARTGLEATAASPRVTFRCCRGTGFPAAYAVEGIVRAARPGPALNDALLARLVRSVPELARVHDAPRIQDEDVLRRALLRSQRTTTSGVGFVITIQPVLWTPTAGEELLAFVGRRGHDLFTAALYTTAVPGLYVHAASLVLTAVPDDEGIALFGGIRDRKLLGWGECDDCREGGSYEYHEEDGTITLGHRW